MIDFSFWEAAENLISPFLVLHVGMGVFLSFISSVFEVRFLICSCCGKEALKKWLWHFICKAWGLWSFSALAGDLCKFSIILFSVRCTFSWVFRGTSRGTSQAAMIFPHFGVQHQCGAERTIWDGKKPCAPQWRATHLGRNGSLRAARISSHGSGRVYN